MAEAANVREWTDLVRRARLGRTVKGIAFLLATYADSDGSRVFPGLARIAVAAEVDYKTAKRAVADLVRCGLLEKVRAHPGRRGRAEEYRLCFDEESMSANLVVLSPDEFVTAVQTVRDKNRRKSTGVPRPRTEADDIDDDTESEVGSTGNGVPPNDGVRGTAFPQYGGARSALPNHVDLVTTSTLHESSAGSRTELALVGPSGSNPVGFCMECYSIGKFVLAVDSVSGDACKVHRRRTA